MKNILFVFFLILFIGCSKNETLEKKTVQTKYSFDNLLGYKDTLFIKSQFTDCGEWGGHNEIIKVYRFKKKTKLVYIKHKVDCGVRDRNGSILQVENFTNEIFLSDFEKSCLMNYINNLMKFKFIAKEFGNSGNVFSVEGNSGKLKISQYGNNIELLNNYNNLMKNLDFPNVIIENQ